MKSKCSVPCLFRRLRSAGLLTTQPTAVTGGATPSLSRAWYKADGRLCVSNGPVAIRDGKRRCEKIDKDQRSGFVSNWGVSPQNCYFQGENSDKPQTSGVPNVETTKHQALQATSPWFLFLLPSALAPGALSLSEHRWIFEDLLTLPGLGSLGIGLPGVVSLGIFLNPMFEAMPRIRKMGHVGEMPMLPYSAMTSQGSVWTAYGLLLNNPAVWTPNLCAALLGMYYMSIYCSHCPELGHLLKSHILKVLGTMGFSVFAYAYLPQNMALNLLGITGNVMTIFMFGGPLTAIRTVVREQNTRALNLGFTCIVNLNCVLWFFYAYFMLDDPYIYLQDGVGILLATLQLGLFARYGVQRH
ncbi:unnamed protein product [Cladocopium goreaui]|uniref:Sugar transporter SWEET1 n=1 Tax=Cladocopium goreaui TaxID=2562237 RepID=A0A9P1M303_9DINO|nr:unnamed protein product [Cladocopium goreaui]